MIVTMRCSPLVSASTLSETWPHQCAGFCAWAGLPSDKQGGIADLQTTAEYGHYLAPFARILLSIAYVREKDKPRAMQLLTSLHAEFPANTLFPREIAHLQAAH